MKKNKPKNMAESRSKPAQAEPGSYPSVCDPTSCTHYSRACSIVAPCCNRVYPCRLCHNDNETHEINRFNIKEVKCRKCDRVQPVNESCINSNCGIRFARYFCSICNLFDDAEKGQYHCTKCGICRVGGKDNFIHCDTCGLCLQVSLKESHKCVQQASRSNCPVCMEDIHTSRNPAHIPDCGHLLHEKCFKEMLENGLYQCPQCQTSLIKMNSHWENMDNERQRWLLPAQLRDFTVKIQCRDCRKDSETTFHFIGLKCPNCGSYNTVRNGNETLPLEDVDPTLPFTTTHDDDDTEDDDIYLLDPINGLMPPPGYQLHPTPSTDSEDEYDTPSSPHSLISDDEDNELAEQLLGGIPLLPPWLPQHGNNPELLHLANQLSLNINLNEADEDSPNEDNVGTNWDNSIELSPYVQLANSFLPMALFGDSGPLGGGPDSDSGLPNIWEVSDTVSDEVQYDDEGGVASGSEDEWLTDSEVEEVGGDEEDLGREECQVIVTTATTTSSTGQQEESNQLGDVAPAN